MKPDELLFWLSARRAGSWQQFRSAVEELYAPEGDAEQNGNTTPDEGEFPVHQRLRLDRLGHIEFFARGCERGWRVVPPTLAAHPVSGGIRAVLCGARSPALVERALRISELVDCKVQVLQCPNAPQVIRFIAPDQLMLQKAATEIGAHFQSDAPLAILSLLPPCDPPPPRSEQAEFPVGADWHIREFNTLTLRWHVTDRQHAQSVPAGLFEFQLYGSSRCFLRRKNRTYEMPRAVALYALLRRRRGSLHYNAKAGTLDLPGSCRPPQLLERALVLCSGFPPSFDSATARLTYTEIPPDVAQLAAELLRQGLK